VPWGIDIAVRRGEITALIGSNGAGKTTLLRALSGLIPMQDGHYFSEGSELTGDTAAQSLAHGIVHVPEGRRLFGAMSIEDNLLMGAYSRKASRAEIARDMERVYTTFPKLLERRDQAAATLSGGEQQMCAHRPGADECAATADDRRIVARPVAVAGRTISRGVADAER